MKAIKPGESNPVCHADIAEQMDRDQWIGRDTVTCYPKKESQAIDQHFTPEKVSEG